MSFIEGAMVPMKSLCPVLDEWLEKAHRDYEQTNNPDGHLSPEQRMATAIWPGAHLDSSIRRLRTIRTEQDYVGFDLADRILCCLDMAHKWREDPELHVIYQGIDLNALDFTKPTCEAVMERNHRKVRWAYQRYGTKVAAARALGLSEPQIKRQLRLAA